MFDFTLCGKADLGIIFDVEAERLGSERIAQLGLTREKFIHEIQLRACPTLGFRADGQDIGGLILMGDELHLAVLPAYHGKWHALWKPAMKWVFSFHATIYGFTEAENKKCQRFMEKNGWHCLGLVAKYGTSCMGYRMTADEIREKYGFSGHELRSSTESA